MLRRFSPSQENKIGRERDRFCDTHLHISFGSAFDDGGALVSPFLSLFTNSLALLLLYLSCCLLLQINEFGVQRTDDVTT